MNDPTPAPREPVRLAEVEAERDRLREALATVVQKGYCVRRDSMFGSPDADPCGTCGWCLAAAALRQPTYTEPGGPE